MGGHRLGASGIEWTCKKPLALGQRKASFAQIRYGCLTKQRTKEMCVFIRGAPGPSLLQRTSHPCDSLQVPNESN